MQKRTILFISLGVLGFIILVSSIVMVFRAMSNKDDTIIYLNSQIEDLNWQIDVFGEVQEVYTVVKAKKSGEVFDPTDIATMTLPSSQITEQFVSDPTELRNAIYKIDVEPGMPLVSNIFTRELLTATDRYYDVVVDLFPVESRVGDYYDIRIVTPKGLDYIVLSKKRVDKFYGSAARMILSEEEIHQYQSCLVDTFINPGTYIYCTTYVEPGMQKKATIYYAVSDLIRAIMEVDPNIVQMAEADLVAKRRSAFEAGLEIDTDSIKSIVGGRSEQVSRLISAAKARIDAQSAAIQNQTRPSTGTVEEGSGGTSMQTGNLLSPPISEEPPIISQNYLYTPSNSSTNSDSDDTGGGGW